MAMDDFTPEQRAAQEKRKAREESVPFEKWSDEWFVELCILEIQDVVENGLAECYSSVDELASDMMANFSWDGNSRTQIQMVLDDERLVGFAGWFREEHGYDILAPFVLSLKQPPVWGDEE